MTDTPKGLPERYRNGEHAQVWSELRALGEEVRSERYLDEARAVARETMTRVKGNLETLRKRWKAKGFVFGYAWAGKEARVEEAEWVPPARGKPLTASVLDAFEKENGVLPVSLRAFYEVIGSVDFVGVSPPADDRWPAREEMDPLQIPPPRLSREEGALILFADPLVKYFEGGVGAIMSPVPSPIADAEMSFEGTRTMWKGEALGLVTYLRSTILERGGMAMFGGATLDQGLVSELTHGLTRF